MATSSFPPPLDASPSIGDGRELSNVTHRTSATPTVNGVREGARYPEDMLEEGEGDAEMDKIIALLEDWAEWERGLEEEAKHCEVARSIKQAADREMPQLDLKNITPQSLKEKKCATEEIENDPTEDTTSARFMKAPNGVPQSGDVAQPSPDIKRAWPREGEKPVATEAKQALEVWTTDRTIRHGSGDLHPDEDRDPQDMKEYGLSQTRRRSLTDATVDRNRKGEIRNRLDSARSKNLAPGAACASFSYEPSFPLRRAYPAVEPSATPSMSFVDRAGVPRGAWYAANTLRQSWKTGAKSTDKRMWERDAPSSTPPATSSLIPANWSRASAWARSPSRETAGGILVKHSFFYGNGGRACSARLASRESWVGVNRCFESPWMRRFRQETERNPSWWVCPQQHHQSLEEAGKTKGRSLSRGQRQSGKRDKSRSTERNVIGTELRKENRAMRRGNTRGTSLWEEVRSYLAARESGESDKGGDGRGFVRGEHSEGGVAATARSQRLDDLSFGDRLRCTPLSQGAWFEDNGSREIRSDSPNALTGGDVHGKVNIALREQSAEANDGQHAGEAAHSEMKTKGRDHIVERSKLKGANARDGLKSVVKGGNTSGVDRSRKSLRSVHDAILTRLRGEIDSATREEIVLRAAEEARGVLERDGVRSATSRRAPSSSLKHTIVIPDSIDYDKVEATLSLIELAARAAGPDAGRQMLTALEALEKMQNRAPVDDESVRSWSSSARVCTTARNGVVRQSKITRGERAIGAGKGKAIGNSSALPLKVNIGVNQLGRENGTVSGALGAQADKHPVVDATFHDKTASKCVEATEPVTAEGIEVFADTKPTLVEKTAAGKAAADADDRTVPPKKKDPVMIADVKINTAQSTLEEGNPVKGGGSLDLEGEQGRAEPPVSSSSEDDTAVTAEGGVAAVPGSGGVMKSINSWLWGSGKPPSRKNSGLSTNGTADLVREETDQSTKVGVGPLDGDLVETLEKGADQKKRPEEESSGEILHTEQNPEGSQEEGASQAMSKGIEDQEAKTSDVEELKEDPLARKSSCEEGRDEERVVQVSIDTDPAPKMLFMEEHDGPFPALRGADATSTSEVKVVRVDDTVGKSCTGLPLSGAAASAGVETRYPRIGDISEGESLGRTESYQEAPNEGKVETGPGEAEKAECSSSCLHKSGSWIAKGTRPQWGRWDGSLPSKDTVRGDLNSGHKKAGVEGSFSTNNAWRTRKTYSPPKLSERFVWPKPDRVCAEKRLRPPDGKREQNTDPTGPRAPSPEIVRRSPLVDAIHPAITRQRKFQEHLQRSRRVIDMCPFDIRGNRENKKQTEFTGSLADTAPVSGNSPPRVASKCSMGVARGTSLRAREPYREREKLPTATSPSRAPAPPRSSSFVSCKSKPTGVVSLDSSDCTTSSTSSNTDGERGLQGLTLTGQQVGRVESWMARARGLLGPKAWECLGSSGAFHRARNRVRMALRLGSPGNDEDGGVFHNELGDWRGMVSEGVAVTMVEGCRREMASFGARRKRSSRVDEATGEDYMTTNLALAAEAVIWILAAERERSNICDAVTRERSRLTSSRCGRAVASDEVLGGGTLESPSVSTELGISLYKARKFVKASKLIDGVYVLEADIDLGFKRWERDAREREVNAAIDMGGASSSAGILGRSPPKRTRLCEVVGCLEVARYGDIRPTATARVCRAHKHDGMVDIGSQRCARPDCGRLAVRVGNRAVTSVALCTLHAREGRLDVEGMLFVLLGLATAMLDRARRQSASSSVEGGPESPGGTCGSRDQVRHQTTIYAVRNTLLALTDQPLVMHNSSSEPPKPIPSGRSRRTLPYSVDSCIASHSTIATPTTSANKRPPRTMDYVKRMSDVPPSRISRDAYKEVEPSLGHKRISWGSNRCDSAGPPRDALRSYAVDGEIYAKKSPGIRRQRSPLSGEIAIPVTDFSSAVGAMKSPMEKGKMPLESSGEAVPPGGVCGGGDSPSDAGDCCDASNLTEAVGSESKLEDVVNLENADGGASDRSRLFDVEEVLRKNARPLTAIFERYSRSSRDNRKEMALPDVLRFCDAFELRPSLVSTREILDVFTSVALPGEMDITDHAIGYQNELPEQVPAKQSLEEEEVKPATLLPSSQSICAERKRSGDNNAGGTLPMPGDIEEDDECSVYFRSDSGSRNLMRSSSRRTSTASSGIWGRRKRTVYLGRSQRFPLRSVDSRLSPGDRGFGLSGVSSDIVLGRRRDSTQSCGSSVSQRRGSSRRASSLSCDVSVRESEAKEPPVVPGLALDQFFHWLSRLATGSPALFESKALHQASAARGRKDVKRACESRPGGGRWRSSDGSPMKRDVAKAVTLLQWMDVSRGMKRDNIPAFNLSSFVSWGPSSPKSRSR